MKRQSVFVLTMVSAVAVGLFAVPAMAVNMTLSDAGLMALDWCEGGRLGGAIVDRRDVPGPGVEFDIYFQTVEFPGGEVSYASYKKGGAGLLVGIDISKYDAFELKFTLVAVDGVASPNVGGRLAVGAVIDKGSRWGYRPRAIGFAPDQKRTAVSSTSTDAEQISMIGFTAYMSQAPTGWKPGTTVTLLIEPTPGAIAIHPPGETAYYYVDAAATGGNNGSSWADAYNYLQDALSAASSGDKIWVAEGIYKPDQGRGIKPGDRSATFKLKNGVTIYGGFPSGGGSWEESDSHTYETILSGDLNGNDVKVANPIDLLDEPTRAENSYHIVTGSGTDATAVLDGFTITGGNANGAHENMNDWGGGMYNKSCSPTLADCLFSRNSAKYAGGMNNSGGSPMLTNCTFRANAAEYAGGMHNFKSNPMLANCTFSGNSARDSGGGMYNRHNSPTLINCTFSGNSAQKNGGGIWNGSISKPELTNCILWANSDNGGVNESAQVYGVEAVVNYCCIQGWTGTLGGTGNIGLDPLFVNLGGDNYRLLPDSPCIDSGDNAAVLSSVAVDLDGNPRLTDGNGDGTATVDMGAYEYGR